MSDSRINYALGFIAGAAAWAALAVWYPRGPHALQARITPVAAAVEQYSCSPAQASYRNEFLHEAGADNNCSSLDSMVADSSTVHPAASPAREGLAASDSRSVQLDLPPGFEPVRIKYSFYCPCEACCGKKRNPSHRGLTASGVYARTGMVAVDSSVKFGSQLIIPGTPYAASPYIAADTGKKIKNFYRTLDDGSRELVFRADIYVGEGNHELARRLGIGEVMGGLLRAPSKGGSRKHPSARK